MYLTCKFKLHNPSMRKRAVLNYALEQYTLAYQELLDIADRELIRAQGMYREHYTAKSIIPLLPRVDAPIHCSLKDSLLQDVASNLASYFELAAADPRTSYPEARDPAPHADDAALDWFVQVGASADDYNIARARLLRQARGCYMPLTFCRCDVKRNFALLRNADKRQLLAVLYLLPHGHVLGQDIGATVGNLVRLDTGEVFASRSRLAILVPLEIGANGWHELKFLEPAANRQTRVKTAKLTLEDDEYFLHVAFEFQTPEPYTPKAYLGVDMGIIHTAAYAVVDQVGAVIKVAHFSDALRALQIKHGHAREVKARNGRQITRHDYHGKSYDAILHYIANTLIALAQEHQAQIVLEQLNVQVRGGRVVSRFRKLARILDYKCKLAGVPLRNVFAAYSSEICHRCGSAMLREDRVVRCTYCGHSDHSDDNAAINIARRALYRKAEWEKRGGYRAFHRSFADDDLLAYQASFLLQD